MLKINKKKVIITTLITLIPMIVGLILWKQLPDSIATHFDSQNQPNGWSSKPFAVFGIPLIMAALHLVCIFLTSADPKKKNINNTAFQFVLWIIPVCSLIVGAVTYLNTFQISIDIGLIISIFIGILFIVLGNYLPKNRNNYTFGVRTPWALNDEDNWRISNRVAGYCFVIAGIAAIIAGFLHQPWILFGAVILAGVVPIVVSYMHYRKHKKKDADKEAQDEAEKAADKEAGKAHFEI